ncbi:MAG: hypothetical protein C3F06_09695 [Candidatus Methanoperedenaceae archaeon]|nr:MAG: hypothetical protein C3F06_09695 [Candidatus Methanoperedenaceae archaeon]
MAHRPIKAELRGLEVGLPEDTKGVLQEALEEEITYELGYSRYDWKNKNKNIVKAGQIIQKLNYVIDDENQSRIKRS